MNRAPTGDRLRDIRKRRGLSQREMQQPRRDAPQWLSQQRYARDIPGRIITRRRTLSPEMRDLADFIQLAL